MEKLEMMKEELLNEKQLYLNELNVIEEKIKNIEYNITKYCGENGHIWVKEVENTMYGETFTYCERCSLEK